MQIFICISSFLRFYIICVFMLMLKFAKNIQIIWSILPIIFICSRSFKCKYFVIGMALLIKFTNIIILKVLHTLSLFEIANIKTLKPGFFINKIIYMRFG